MKALGVVVSVAACVVFSASADSPSEAFLKRARSAYAPGCSDGTNSVVLDYKVDGKALADRPSPGDRVGWIHVDGIRNFRDIGGWTGLRKGRAFRGTEPDCPRLEVVGSNHYHNLNVTALGLKTIRETLGIKTDLDLRKASECPNPERSVLGIRLVRAPVRPYMELFQTTNAWAAALRTFADARNYPIYFHCWGGADRTGILALLLEGLCGATEADLHIDYELTSFAGYVRSRAPDGPAKSMFLDLYNAIRGYPGANLSEKIAALMETTIGLTKEEIEAIRANLTDDQPTAVASRRGTTLVTQLDWYTNEKKWSPMDYETVDGIRGTLLWASWGAPDRARIEIPLPARGRHRILIGTCGTAYSIAGAPCQILLRLKRDPAPVYMDATAAAPSAGWWAQPVENDWKEADLDGDTLVVEKPHGASATLAWVRLVPIDGDAAKPVRQHDIIATNDGYAPVAAFDELLAPIMRLKDSPASEIHYCVGNGAFAFGVPSKVAIPCTYSDGLPYMSDYSERCARGFEKLWKEHPDLLNELADFTHSLGMKFCVSFRTGPAIDHMRFSEQGREATAINDVDVIRRAENYCRLWDGTPVARFSYAKKEVQDWFLRFYAEMLTPKADGISLLWIRALPAMLFEPAFRERFKAKYGEELSEEKDPRVRLLRAEIMTEFHRKVRALAGSRKVTLFVPPDRETCLSFGLDLRRLAEEGLADELVVNYSKQTAEHTESPDFFDYAYLREATAGTKTAYRGCMWCSETEYSTAIREGAVGMACWDMANKPWFIWERLRLMDDDGSKARAWENANPIEKRTHPFRLLNGFDARHYPWHVAY